MLTVHLDQIDDGPPGGTATCRRIHYGPDGIERFLRNFQRILDICDGVARSGHRVQHPIGHTHRSDADVEIALARLSRYVWRLNCRSMYRACAGDPAAVSRRSVVGRFGRPRMIKTLRDHLFEYSHTADIVVRSAIEREIWQRFGAERTVLVLDMSGFSRLTRQHGIIHYLSMVRRMQESVRPIVHERGGSVVKFEADNAFTVFPDPYAGIQAAIAINQAAEQENAIYAEAFDIHLSVGIDHGRILLIEGEDFFGDAVNTASKLGEDLAQAGEILVSHNAMDAVPVSDRPDGRQVKFSISGIDVEAFAIAY